MSSNGFNGFLFVNAGDTSSPSHKASSSARAFVMRKARADQVWSTRSTKSVDRRRNRDAEGKPSSTGEREKDSELFRIVQLEEESFQDNEKKSWQSSQAPSPNGERQVVPLTPSRSRICRQCHKRTSDPCPQLCAGCLNSLYESATYAWNPGINGSPDPFNSVAVVLDQGANTLLSYFDRAISPQITPIGGMLQPSKVQQDWLAPSFHQPAFMHAILCVTALQLSITRLHEPQYQVMAMHHRLKAIKAVQQNLADPEKAVSDENIAAVFNLLCVEENLFLPAFAPVAKSQLRADASQRLAHMKGLKEMIGMRGGVRGLSSNRALQSFLLRHTAVQAVTSFEIPYLLPKGLIGQLYDYPNSSRFSRSLVPMAMACRRVGIKKELTEIVKSAECLIEDTKVWFAMPNAYTWDALDIQNLYSISIDRFERWYLENESTLSALEGIISLCSIVFLAFICRSKETVYSAIPSLLSRLQQHLLDPNVVELLRLSQLDIWVGLLVVLGSEGHPGYEDYFFKSYLHILACRRPVLCDFEDLEAALKQCLWTSRPMDLYALEIWNETPDVWKSPIGTMNTIPDASYRRIKTPSTPTASASAIAASNPYTNGHPKAHITVDTSAYNL